MNLTEEEAQEVNDRMNVHNGIIVRLSEDLYEWSKLSDLIVSIPDSGQKFIKVTDKADFLLRKAYVKNKNDDQRDFNKVFMMLRSLKKFENMLYSEVIPNELLGDTALVSNENLDLHFKDLKSTIKLTLETLGMKDNHKLNDLLVEFGY